MPLDPTIRVDCDTLDDLRAPTRPEKAMLSLGNEPTKRRKVKSREFTWSTYAVVIGGEVSLLNEYQNHDPFLLFLVYSV